MGVSGATPMLIRTRDQGGGEMSVADPPASPPSTHSFAGWNDEPLPWRHWPCSSPPRAALILVHGIGGHSGQFDRLAVDLTRHGYEVFAFDLPGHGSSAGPRGWIPCWDAFRQSLRRFIHHIACRDASRPLFLLGHSMGATICVDLALRESLPIRGMILSNPAVDAGGVQLWRRWLARLLAWAWPTFAVSTGIPLDVASRDPAVLRDYASDPLRHNRCTASLGNEFMATAAWIRRSCRHLRSPLLLLQSGADLVTPAGSARRFFETIGSPDRTWKLYPRSYHELFADLDREQVIQDLVGWIRSHDG